MPLLTSRAEFAQTFDAGPPSPLRIAEAEGKKLRIALVTEYYYPHLGGVTEHVHYFAQEARKFGHHVDIITSNIPNAEPDPHVIRLGYSQSIYSNGSQARITLGWGLRREMRRALSRGDYDIVHIHSPLHPVLPVLAMQEAQCPVVGTFHTYFDSSLGYTVFRKQCQRRLDSMQAVIAVSHSTTIAMNRYFDVDWTIIPNGIDLDVFRPDVPKPAQIRDDMPSILFLGRFDPRNGLTTLIDSFRKVRGRNREAQLVVVGDGPLRKHYYRAAGGDPDITFVGAILKERPNYYAHSTIYACPTTKASFGITLLESMACETPIVCSDILGFRDVVKNEREALMTHCGDTTELADALVRLLDDEDLQRRLGKVGRERAQHYSWQSVTSAVLDVYAAVLGRVPTGA
ncbi:MAG: glycosyltransferase family 4 protein [Gemmatimonadaceae bacterium]|nr:glycosyltransferase family 4 protein [Gemmatimonadaceae bacterium]